MEYRYLDHIAIADAAFEARGKDLESLFTAAADATMNLMVEELDSIRKQTARDIYLVDSDIDILLFQFLQELIFFKDAEKLLLRVSDIRISQNEEGYALTTELSGEPIDASRHELNVDVKAVTLHRFKVAQTHTGWTATVVLDI